MLELDIIFVDSNSDFSVKVVWSFRFSDLFYVCVPGEAADITTAAAEAEDERHQKPRPLQSTK